VILRTIPDYGKPCGRAAIFNKLTDVIEDAGVCVYTRLADANYVERQLVRLCPDGQTAETRHLPLFRDMFPIRLGQEYRVLLTGWYPLDLYDAIHPVLLSRSDYFRVFSEVVGALQLFHQAEMVDGEMTYNCFQHIGSENIKVVGVGRVAILTNFADALQMYEYPAGTDVDLVDRTTSPRAGVILLKNVPQFRPPSRRSDLVQLVGLLVLYLDCVVGCTPFARKFYTDFDFIYHLHAVKIDRIRAMLTDVPAEYAALRDIFVRLYSEYDALSGDLPYAWIQEQLLAMGAG